MSILQAAPSIGIPTLERAVRLEEVFTADEIFVSHTGIRILPIARFEDRTLDAPGPVTGKLMGLMDRIFSFSEDRFKDWFFPM